MRPPDKITIEKKINRIGGLAFVSKNKTGDKNCFEFYFWLFFKQMRQ